MKNNKLSLLLLLGMSSMTFSQVGIGVNQPDNSAMLDITSTNKGILIPRVDLQSLTDVTTVPNPANGLTVFQVTDLVNNPFNTMVDGYYYWSAADGNWVKLHTSVDNWNLKGNAGTNPAGGTVTDGNFLGTTDAKDFQIKVGTDPVYNEIMRVKNAKGHVQFGNWRNISDAQQTADPDVFLNSGAPTTIPANFAVQNNFAANDLSTAPIINNTRSVAYLNATGSNTFYNNMNYVSVGNNGYTGALVSGFNQIRIFGGGTVNVSSVAGQTAGSIGLISLATGTNLTGSTNFGSAGVFGNYSNSGTVNNAAAAVLGGTVSGNGTFNGTFAAVRALMTSSANNIFNGQTTGVQASINGGTFNNTVGAALIGIDANIPSTASINFAANTSVYGLHSNVSASNIANGYGLYIEDVSGTMSQYGFYQAGATDSNYFAGNIGIGIANPSAQLHTTGTVRLTGLGTNIVDTKVLTADASGNITTRATSTLLPQTIAGCDGADAMTTTVNVTTATAGNATGILFSKSFTLSQQSRVTFLLNVNATVLNGTGGSIATSDNTNRLVAAYINISSFPAAYSGQTNICRGDVSYDTGGSNLQTNGFFNLGKSRIIVLPAGNYTVDVTGLVSTNAAAGCRAVFGSSTTDQLDIIAEPIQ